MAELLRPAGAEGDYASRWLMLALLFAARTTLAFQFQSIAALGPVLIDDLAIDYALLGTLVGLYLIPGVVIAVPGGLLGQRFGEKTIAVLGLALMAAGGAWLAWSETFAAAAAGRLVSGTGAVLLNILLTKMVADWFAGREMVTAMALLVSSWPVGIGVALIVIPALATATSGAGALMSAALICAVALVAILAVYRPPPDLVAAPASLRFHLSGREWALAVLSGMVWCLFNVGLILVLTFGPAFLAAQGWSVPEAGATVSIVTWAFVACLPVGALIAQRLRRPDAAMVGCLLAMAGAIALLPTPVAPALLFLAIGLFSAPPAGLIMKLPTEGLKAENRAAGMGIFYSCYYAGMAGLVPVAGVLRDYTASPSAPLLFAAAMVVGAIVSLGLFRAVQRHAPAMA